MIQGQLKSSTMPAVFSAVLMTVIGCSNEIDNNPPAQDTRNPEYEQKISKLENKVGALDATTEYHADGFKLTYESQKSTEKYLSTLSANINGAREKDLPEWQEMYRTLTDDAARNDPNYRVGLGKLAKETNFYKQQLKLNDHDTAINAHDGTLKSHTQSLSTQQDLLNLHVQNIADINDSIKKMNELLEVRFSALDAKLTEFEKRIVAAEELAKTTQSVIQAFVAENKAKISQMSSRQDRIDAAFQELAAQAVIKRLSEVEREIKTTITNEIANTKKELADTTKNTNKNTGDIADLDTRAQVAKSQIDQLWPAINKVSIEAKKFASDTSTMLEGFKTKLRRVLEVYLNLTEEDSDNVFGPKKAP